jgi:hypothetical protein
MRATMFQQVGERKAFRERSSNTLRGPMRRLVKGTGVNGEGVVYFKSEIMRMPIMTNVTIK